MLRFTKLSSGNQRGFTLIEVMIMVVIFGIIAAIVIPALGEFLNTGKLNAANTEAVHVKTAALGYYTDHESWPLTSESLGGYLEGEVKAVYIFDDIGIIESANTDDAGWGIAIWFNPSRQMWERGSP